VINLPNSSDNNALQQRNTYACFTPYPVAETAALLRVSVDTIKRQIKLGFIPTKRIRTSVRVSRAWLDTYVAETAPFRYSRV
jgi:excisionase family DNA binding protein